MNKITKGALFASVALTAAITGGAAWADAAGAADAAKPSKGNVVEEVVVTAEKRSVNLQEVPVAVTAFTSKERALIGINSVQDMTNFTPGLTYSSQLDRPVMRGLARSTNIYAADSSVGVYDNDLFTNSTFLVGRDDMIVDQVEVLLGPQNTLYGRNAIGGVINTQSRRPSETFGGEVRAAIGNYKYNKVEATVTGPITAIDGLSFRLSGYNVDQDQGYFKNTAGKSTGEVHHDPYVELQLQYKKEKDEIWFMAYDLRFNGDRGGPGGLLGTPTIGAFDTELIGSNTLFFNPDATVGIIPGSAITTTPGSVNPTTLKNRTISQNTPTSINVHGAYSLNFHWTHHFDGFDMKYVGGYSQYYYSLTGPNFLNQPSGVTSYQLPLYPLAAVGVAAGNVCGYHNALAAGSCSPLKVSGQQSFTFATQTDWWSHELTFSSTTAGPLSWIAGAYYYDETDNNPETEASNQPQLNGSTWNVVDLLNGTEATQYIGSLLGAAPAPAQTPYNPSQSGQYLVLDYQDHINTSAVFAQTDYKFNDQWKLTAGIRYTYDRKSAQEEARYLQFTNSTLAGLLGQYTPVLDITRFLVSYGPGKGVVSPVTFPTTGPYAGDAVRHLRDHSDAVTGTLGLEWTPDKSTLAYARYNRGYKAFALNAGFVGANAEAAPESVNDYELGLKKSWFEKTLTFDVAMFYYDYANDQLPLAQPVLIPGGSTNLTQFINIPKAVSDGIEVTTGWTPMRNLHLSLTYGYDHTEILTDCPAFTGTLSAASNGCFLDPADPLALAQGAKPRGNAISTWNGTTSNNVVQSVKGNSLPQSPENKIAFNANYTWEFEPGNLTVSGSYIWKDKSYSSIFTRNQYDVAPSWSQVDLRGTWTSNHGNYELVAYVKNLFDTIGYDAAAGATWAAAPAGGLPSGSRYTYQQSYDLTPPRLVGAEVHYHF